MRALQPELVDRLNDRLVLRPSVTVRDCSGDLLIQYAHWELRLPQHAVATSGELQRFAADRSLKPSGDATVRGVIALLAAQGCFLPALPDRVRLRDVFLLFQPIRSELYAAYYAHPLWRRLREGSASTGVFAAWVIHNYHISRSAGIIAARMALQPLNPSICETFRDDALEEYWHCDAFYFVKCGRLPIDPARAKAYLPLPAIRAFEDIALRAAETDWLAHLLIAYFQESSVIFGDASESFYDAVERQYDIPDFFKGWRRHLTLDRDHGHAEGLAALFADDRYITREAVAQSMQSLQFAHHFLMLALDQIEASPADFEEAVEDRQPERIAKAQQKCTNLIANLPEAFWPFVSAKLMEAAVTALAHGREHDGIIAAGTLAAMLRNITVRNASNLDNPWLAAVGSFLVEQALDLKLLLALSEDIIGASFGAQLEKGTMTKLAAARVAIGAPSRLALAVARYQLRELVELALSSTPLIPLILGVPSNVAVA